MARMTAGDTWIVSNTRADPRSLGQHNSVFTVSNGYLGIKGKPAENRAGYHPTTIINGVYDEMNMFGLLRPSKKERRYLDPDHFDTAGSSPAVANLPNPLAVRVFADGGEIALERGAVEAFHQALDLRSGVYDYSFVWRDECGRATRVSASRFAALDAPHRVHQRYEVTPLDHDGSIWIWAGIDGSGRCNTTGERQFEVTETATDVLQRCRMTARTNARRVEVILMAQDAFADDAQPAAVETLRSRDAVYNLYRFAAEPGRRILMDRAIVLASSEDLRHNVSVDADAELTAAAAGSFDAALERQRAAWSAAWSEVDIRIEGDDLAQRYLRFCLHHLLAAAPRHTDKLSVPVKLLTGEYYQGNTFYDTDIYILPFYIFARPDLARRCLNWRHLGLEHGRDYAREIGCSGAKLAWQAGPYGEECLGHWYRFTRTNIHINADVIYALMQYHRATGDEAFMQRQGIDLLVESARFYASRARYDEERDAYDMYDVTGPDEGHCGCTNEFYTNYLAIRSLRWAADAVDGLSRGNADEYRAAADRLQLGSDEPANWRRVADRLTILHDPATGLYEQCRDFFNLAPVPPRFGRDREVWFETVSTYQALNQPDVLMAMVLFPDDFPAESRRANWEYYKDKSMNFSSMSFALNAMMAVEMGDMDGAYRDFMITAGMDLDEELTGRRDTYAGLHGTAAGGAWLVTVFGFGGVRLAENGLRIAPRLPAHWRLLRFTLAYHGQRLRIEADQQHVRVRLADDAKGPLTLEVAGHDITLAPGESSSFNYRA